MEERNMKRKKIIPKSAGFCFCSEKKKHVYTCELINSIPRGSTRYACTLPAILMRWRHMSQNDYKPLFLQSIVFSVWLYFCSSVPDVFNEQ